DVPDPPRGVVARVVAADPEVADDVVRVVDEVEHRVVRGGSTRREGPIERVAGVLFSGAWRLACSDQVRLVLGLAPLQPRGKPLCGDRDEGDRHAGSLTAARA